MAPRPVAQIIALEDWRTRRRHRRHRALWWGQLTIGASSHACSIFDLSLGGAKLKLSDSALTSAPRTKLTLGIPPFGQFDGEIKWTAHPFIGVQFGPAEEERIADLLREAETDTSEGCLM